MGVLNSDGLWVTVPVLMLAWANGANDVCKGVATLLGSGAASPQHTVLQPGGIFLRATAGLLALFRLLLKCSCHCSLS
jgi:phosphate/sulfate permease